MGLWVYQFNLDWGNALTYTPALNFSHTYHTDFHFLFVNHRDNRIVSTRSTLPMNCISRMISHRLKLDSAISLEKFHSKIKQNLSRVTRHYTTISVNYSIMQNPIRKWFNRLSASSRITILFLAKIKYVILIHDLNEKKTL